MSYDYFLPTRFSCFRFLFGQAARRQPPLLLPIVCNHHPFNGMLFAICTQLNFCQKQFLYPCHTVRIHWSRYVMTMLYYSLKWLTKLSYTSFSVVRATKMHARIWNVLAFSIAKCRRRLTWCDTPVAHTHKIRRKIIWH